MCVGQFSIFLVFAHTLAPPAIPYNTHTHTIPRRGVGGVKKNICWKTDTGTVSRPEINSGIDLDMFQGDPSDIYENMITFRFFFTRENTQKHAKTAKSSKIQQKTWKIEKI